ncbi:MAG: spore maturation protein [Bacillota bacterium]
MGELINLLSQWAIPGIIFFIIVVSFYKQINVYDVFTTGAMEGFSVALKILPCLIAMLMAINIFRNSGALNILLNLISKPLKQIGVPAEIIPLGLIRPLSGTGSLAIVADIINKYGADSFIGKVASTIQGSTETTFYVATIYFGAVKIKNTRHAILAGLLADLAGFFAAIFICQLVFN